MKQHSSRHYVLLKKGVLGIAVALFGALTAPSMAAIIVDFDSATSFSSNFTNVGGNSITGWNASQGRGGSGTMFLQATGHTANIYSGVDNAFSLTSGDSLVMSYFFYEVGTRSAVSNIGTYLTMSPSANPLDSGTTTGVLRTFFYNMDPSESGNQSNFRYSGTGGTGNVGTNFVGGGNGFWTPNANTWWQLEATYTKSSTLNLWDVTVKISNWGADGMTNNPASLITLTQTVTNADLYNASSIYAGFESYQQSRGATKIDTFSMNVIPEPSAATLLCATGIAAIIFARRSRKKMLSRI